MALKKLNVGVEWYSDGRGNGLGTWSFMILSKYMFLQHQVAWGPKKDTGHEIKGYKELNQKESGRQWLAGGGVANDSEVMKMFPQKTMAAVSQVKEADKSAL